MFSALIVVSFTLTFPGVFAPIGLLGAGLQTAPWLYFFWHVGLPLSIMAFALLKNVDQKIDATSRPSAVLIALSIFIVVAIVVGLTLLCTAREDLLPKFLADRVTINSTVQRWYAPPLLTVSAAALAALLFKRRSVLDLWLCVMCWAWLLESLMGAVLAYPRFSFIWYGSRTFALACSIVVLIALLSETTSLYAHLARAVARQRQSRELRNVAMETMAASIGHEIRQPLAAMMLNADAATVTLSGPAPDIEKAKSALARVTSNGLRARQVLDSIRQIFRKDPGGRVLFAPNDVLRDVLTLTEVDLRVQHVSIAASLGSELPQILADKGQLRQVLMNLIFNAVEAMQDVTDRPRELRLRSDVTQDNSNVVIAVEDSGTGVDEKHIERIFEPFFTTKPAGTGVGLAICRRVVEDHGGRLMASPNTPYGMVFQIYLPVQKT